MGERERGREGEKEGGKEIAEGESLKDLPISR